MESYCLVGISIWKDEKSSVDGRWGWMYSNLNILHVAELYP